MTHHPLWWLWLWFFIGNAIYILKRAYYLVTGPNPVANTYSQFFARCWIPLLVRLAIDGGIYWLSFYPDMVNGLLSFIDSHFGVSWQLHSPIPHYAVVAFFFGLGIDTGVDFAVSKIPWVKDWLPQMPGPLKPAATTTPVEVQ